jgi:SAM-dependent methyltransferase
VAPQFLSWLAVPAGPSPGFRETAQRNLAGRAAVHAGDATQIALPDAVEDVVVSGLVLNFVPDVRAALQQMARVAVDGGTVAAYVWDYGGRMELMRIFWDAAVELDAQAAALDEGRRFPLCRPEALAEAFASAGLRGVRVDAIDLRHVAHGGGAQPPARAHPWQARGWRHLAGRALLGRQGRKGCTSLIGSP